MPKRVLDAAVRRAIQRWRGNVTAAAASVGMSPKNFRRRLRQLRIDVQAIRKGTGTPKGPGTQVRPGPSGTPDPFISGWVHSSERAGGTSAEGGRKKATDPYRGDVEMPSLGAVQQMVEDVPIRTVPRPI